MPIDDVPDLDTLQTLFFGASAVPASLFANSETVNAASALGQMRRWNAMFPVSLEAPRHDWPRIYHLGGNWIDHEFKTFDYIFADFIKSPDLIKTIPTFNELLHDHPGSTFVMRNGRERARIKEWDNPYA
jgi:hypothetical protein